MKDVETSAMNFDEVSMWVRVYDLLIGSKSADTIKQIGGRIGEVIEIDKETILGITRSVQIKVRTL